MKVNVLIPVKSLDKSKSRLVQKLNDSQRKTLMTLLFRHLVIALKNSNKDLDIFVVSNDPKIINLTHSLKINHISEKQSGHNEALTDAAKKLNPLLPLLTISADLPFVNEADINNLISLSGNTDAVLVPSKEKTGTNAIVLKKPLLIPYVFGINSFAHFKKAILEKRLPYKTYFNDSLAFDIDTIDDFENFKSQLKNNFSFLHKYYDKVVE